MKTTVTLIRRNVLMFFKDKGLFFTSLITPLILLVLYISFLGNVYRDAFVLSIPEFMNIPDEIINGCVGGQLMSSLLAVCCVTVAFCSNMLMVQDKVTGAHNDFAVTPVKSSHVALGYYVATAIATMIVCLVALCACFIYLATIGWYLSVSDICFILLDIFLIVMFGTALSSIINFFLSSQGQISTVGAIVSSCYGFICGAYMPISQYGEGLQKVISLLPGTYATSLLRNHSMQGALEELENAGLSSEAIEGIKDSIDCNIYFFDKKVPLEGSLIIVSVTVVLLITVYVLLNKLKGNKAKK